MAEREATTVTKHDRDSRVLTASACDDMRDGAVWSAREDEAAALGGRGGAEGGRRGEGEDAVLRSGHGVKGERSGGGGEGWGERQCSMLGGGAGGWQRRSVEGGVEGGWQRGRSTREGEVTEL